MNRELSPREEQVIRCLAKGSRNKEIAEELKMSAETAKEHVANILWKLGVSNRVKAAIWADRHGYGEGRETA